MPQQVLIYSSDFCPYCIRAKALLTQKHLAFNEIRVDGKPELRAQMMQKSGKHTVPQIWIGEQHIGGCDDLYALERSGQLDRLLSD